ncbi:MAG: nitrogen regulation protein NR(II) [Haloferacaceae archaeon]
MTDEGPYQRLLEAVADHALFTLDADGNIAMWPEVAQQLYGYDPDDVVGRQLDVLIAEPRGEPPPIEDLLAEAETGTVKPDSWHQRADGSVFWGSCTLSPLSDGDSDGYAVVVQDTTTRKQYERMLERRNDRLKGFTDILSHDLRTPLSTIDARLELFHETGEAEHLAAIEETTDRMERLVEDLLRVARQGQVVEDPAATDLGDVLDVAREGALPGTATLRYESVRPVMADPDRLVQMLENPLRNSAEHGGDDITVRVGPFRSGFYVEDDGPGIPESDRDRVFDHGYTTREDGTGYGLSIVRSIVGAHGWDVSIGSEDEGGARFEITGIEFVDRE